MRRRTDPAFRAHGRPRLSARGWLRWASLLALLSASPAAAQPRGAGRGAQLRRQAEHYHRRGHLEAALEALERARVEPDGAEDFAAHLLEARLRHDALQLEQAFPLADDARRLAATPDQRRAADDLLRDLHNRYGGVRIRATAVQGAQRGRIRLSVDPAHPLIDPHKKKTFERIRRRLEQTALHDGAVIYLPYGHYVANRHPFVLERDSSPAAVVSNAGALRELFVLVAEGPDKEPTEERTPWWYWVAGGGAVLLTGAAVGAVLWATGDDGNTTYEGRITTAGGYGGRWGSAP